MPMGESVHAGAPGQSSQASDASHTGFARRTFGATGMNVSPLGVASSYGLAGRDVERAFERGITFFVWGALRKRDFARGLANLAQKNRERITLGVQSYTRVGMLMEWSLDRALRALKTDYVDLLGLGWWNGPVPRRIVDAALALREKGKVRHLMISCHHRPAFEGYLADPAFEALMIRYNAAHPGAEREVFPHFAVRRPGAIAFTATRWGTLLDPKLTPKGDPTPRASDCYRFALSSPHIDVSLTGPKNGAELDEALAAVERGPMTEEELAWMRRVGVAVRDANKDAKSVSLVRFFDKLVASAERPPKQLS